MVVVVQQTARSLRLRTAVVPPDLLGLLSASGNPFVFQTFQSNLHVSVNSD